MHLEPVTFSAGVLSFDVRRSFTSFYDVTLSVGDVVVYAAKGYSPKTKADCRVCLVDFAMYDVQEGRTTTEQTAFWRKYGEEIGSLLEQEIR